MAAGAREGPRSWWIWALAGLAVAVLVIGAWRLAQDTQGGDLPRPPDLSVEVPRPSSLPQMPNLPPAPTPTPR